MNEQEIKALLDHATARGQLIEAGWLGFRIAAVPEGASQVQVDSMRDSFFAGCAHMFHSIMTTLDPGTEATQADLSRMTMIDNELQAYLALFAAKHGVVMRRAAK